MKFRKEKAKQPASQPQGMTIEQAIGTAYAHWSAGQAPQAEHLCRQVLALWPEHPDALHILGLLAHGFGNLDNAFGYMRRACAAPRAPALFHSNFAEMLRQGGQLTEAETEARRAVALDGNAASAWGNLGIILQEADKLADSLQCLIRVCEMTPASPEAHNNLGNTYKRLGRLDEARKEYAEAIRLNPSYPEAHSNLANLLHDLGALDEAMAMARRAIELAPRNADAYLNAAAVALAGNQPGEAVRWIDNILSFAPGHPGALRAKAEIQRHAVAVTPQSGAAQAENHRQKPPRAPEEICPASAPGERRDGMNTVLTQQEAELQARQALDADDPEKAEALARALAAGGMGTLQTWSVLAKALGRQGRLAEAKPIQEMLVDQLPGNMELRFDLAVTLLQLGDFDRGWREYRHRYNMVHTAALERKVRKPRWDGGPLAGKTLLIHDEQGYGDTFQFIRLLPWAKKKSGARLVLQIVPEQESFARRMDGIDEIVLRGQVPPPFDMYCEMMSLPMAMGLTLSDLPGTVPYLTAHKGRLQKWRRRLKNLPRPIVALVWGGRPEHVDDAKRSIPLATLAPLGGVEGCSFISVQKGPKAAEAKTPPAGLALTDLDEEIADFDDTAAILSVADLLISVDSAPVHLAGGLNRPAWVMLPFSSEWRWLTEREDSPWYPSLRLFRQDKAGDWDGVVRRMADALREFRDRGRA